MDVSYIIEKSKIKIAKWGTLKKYFFKKKTVKAVFSFIFFIMNKNKHFDKIIENMISVLL
jgi:hypothetical protein